MARILQLALRCAIYNSFGTPHLLHNYDEEEAEELSSCGEAEELSSCGEAEEHSSSGEAEELSSSGEFTAKATWLAAHTAH